jgi:Kdo2-lipid IVA lauroyltransferase/acyltransferase
VGASKRPTRRDDIVYGGLLLLARLARALPLRTGLSLGRGLGRLAWHVVRRERNKALRHLAAAFPERTEAERRRIARAMFRHLGESIFEIAWIPRLNPAALARTTEIHGIENLREAVEAGRGVVLFTGHCGNWEWLCAVIALSGFQLNPIAREIDDPRLNEFITGIRASQGAKTIGRGSSASAKEMLQTLRRGEILGVLIDQSIRADSVELPFFGRPAPTPVGAARIAVRAGAAVLTAFDERRDGRHIVRFDRWRPTSRGDDPGELTAAMHRTIEEQIARRPEQWVWMHDRWRRR